MKNPIYKYTRFQICKDYVIQRKEMGDEKSIHTIKTRLDNLNKFLNIFNINSVGKRYAELNCDDDGSSQLDVMNDDSYYSEDDKAIMFAWLDEFYYGFIHLFPMKSNNDEKGYYTIPLNKQTKENADTYKAEYLAFQKRMNELVERLSDDNKKQQMLALCDIFTVFDTSLLEDKVSLFDHFIEEFETILKSIDPMEVPELRKRAENDWLLWLSKIKEEYVIEDQNGQEVFPFVRKK